MLPGPDGIVVEASRFGMPHRARSRASGLSVVLAAACGVPAPPAEGRDRSLAWPATVRVSAGLEVASSGDLAHVALVIRAFGLDRFAATITALARWTQPSREPSLRRRSP